MIFLWGFLLTQVNLDGIGHCDNSIDGLQRLNLKYIEGRKLEAQTLVQNERWVLVSEIPALNHLTIGIPPTESDEGIAIDLWNSGNFERITRDCILAPAVVPNDAQWASQTYLATMGAPAAWDITTGSSSITIAILDTGVDSTHADITSLIVPGVDTPTCTPTSAPGCGTTTPISVAACATHGTNVASIAGAVGNNTIGMAGVTWTSRIMPIRVTSDVVNCTASSADIAEGIVWASQNGARVINVSFSGAWNPLFQDAAAQARRNGSLVIFASGNFTSDLTAECTANLGPTICNAITQPDILIVGSVSAADTLSAFSNYGSLMDMVAPGENIVIASAGGGYTTGNGTSYSAPLVSGAAALILSVRPNLNPLELQHILLQSSLDLGSAGKDNSFGVGRLRIDQALTLATTSDPLTSFADNRDLDLLIPKGPAKILTSDQQVRGGPTSRLMMFTETNPGLLSFQASDMALNDLMMSELPRTDAPGRASLFYMKDDTSADFVYTDNARKNVYLGSTTAFGVTAENPIINTKSCGPFEEISDIHLTEDATGTTSRLIIADRKANTVYSYVLDPDGSTLCTSELTTTVTNPLWIRSVNSVNPRIYIGSKDTGGLKIRAYQNSTLTATSAQQTITTSSTAGFTKPIVDTTNNELWVPVGLQNNSAGNDFLYRFDYGTYPPGTIPSIETCQSPLQVLQDHAVASRLTYVMCPTEKVIEIYDTTYALVSTIPLTYRPRKMLVGSDGTNRYIALLRSDNSTTIYSSTVAASPPAWTANSVVLPQIMDDMGHFGALDYAIFVNSENNLITHVNLSTHAVTTTNYLPRSIDAIVAQSAYVSHFVTSTIDRAYTLEEFQNGAWGLRTYTVHDFPMSIIWRPNRLYVLNRDSSDLSVIDLATGTQLVGPIATQTRPVSMAFNATLNRLWIANETGNSVTTLNATVGSEALVSHTALGYSPKKIVHQTSDNTVYAMGASSVRLLDGTSLATVRTAAFTSGVSDIALVTGGVWATSRNGISGTYLDRSTTTATNLTYSPLQVTSNSSIGVAALPSIQSVRSSAGNSWNTGPFNQIFSTLTNLFVYNQDLLRLRIYPYSQMGSSTFGGASLTLTARADNWSSDSSGNLWIAQKNELKVQRLSSNLQAERLKNLAANRPVDLAGNATLNRLYVLMRNMNAIAVYDTANSRASFYSVCQSPSQMILDSTNSRIFVLCTDLNSLAVISLNSMGDISSQQFLATGLSPIDMAYNSTSNKIYIVNKNSSSVYIFNGASLGTAPTSVTVTASPQGISWNSANNNVYVVHEGSKVLTTINGTTNAATSAAITTFGLSRTETNNTTNSIWSISRSPGSIYSSLVIQNYSSVASSISPEAVPYELSISPAQDKTYVTYPSADAVRIYDETNSDLTDVTVGDDPRFVLADDTAARIYVANFAADTISVLSPTTDAVLSTVSLSAGCGPSKMRRLNVGGTNYIFVACSSNDTLEWFHATTYGVGTPISLRLP